jgi:soluble lytic murein transglycosylase
MKLLCRFKILKLKNLFFLFLLQTSIVGAQNLSDGHLKIRSALADHDYASAFDELQNLRRADAKIFAANNYDYLLARVAEKRRDAATAAVFYQSVVRRNSPLKAYALWHLAKLMRASGNLAAERVFLLQLQTVAPDSLLVKIAHLRSAQSAFESRDFAQTIKMLTEPDFSQSEKNPLSNDRVKNSSPSTNELRSIREKNVLLARAFKEDGRADEARNRFQELIAKLPDVAQPDDFALAAARALDELDRAKTGESNGSAPRLADVEHWRRASIYQFNRDFANAINHLEAIIERHPNSVYVPDALLQTGRIANQENRQTDAIPFFERVMAEFPEHPAARDALNFEASAYARLGNTLEAVTHYQKFIERYVDKTELDNPERPFLNIVDALRDAGRDDEALTWIAQTRQKFAGDLPAALALFSEARLYLAQGNWTRALTSLEALRNEPNLGNLRAPGGTTLAEVAFLRAFCLEQLNRTPDALDAYLEIPDGRNEYYGWRATERIKNLARQKPEARRMIDVRANLLRLNAAQAIAAGDFERARTSAQTVLRLSENADLKSEMLDVARRAYEKLEIYRFPAFAQIEFGRKKVLTENAAPVSASPNIHQKIADELLFLGLYDEAAPELEAALHATNPKSKIANQKSKIDPSALALARIYQRGDLAQRAVSFAEPVWRSVPSDYLLELAPAEMLELLYPAPYRGEILQFAPPRNVDARFVLSIMRQESRFRADVKSNAAARGLMQFISTTSQPLALELNRTNFQQDDLYDPETAILFGSQYLQNIFRQFPGQPQAVAAAYNGGEANMARWLLRSRTTDADRYVAEIQFAQSKDYVFKVLANFRVYQLLYNEQLRRRAG